MKKLIWKKNHNTYYTSFTGIFYIIMSFKTIKGYERTEFRAQLGEYPNYTYNFLRFIPNVFLENQLCFENSEEFFKAEAEMVLFDFIRELERKLN